MTALVASACTPTGRAITPPPSIASPHHVVSGELRTCIPLSEFENGDVDNAVTHDRDFPWLRDDPAVADGFDLDQLISGGPGPDGIEPIDRPCFDSLAAADRWIEPQSPVMVVEVDDDRRAYPLAIMIQHEIVNDVVGGEDFVGTELERIPTALLGWQQFTQAAPDGVVLSRESMPGRDYGVNPYTGYEGSGDGFLFDGPTDDRFRPNARVLGIGSDRDPVAIPLDHLRSERVVDREVDGERVTVWWAPGQASALDDASVDGGSDVGSTAVFVRVLEDGTELDFAPGKDDPTVFVDAQTGSTWNLFGEAVAGELSGTQLGSVARNDTFWFVWFAFQPDTEIVDDSRLRQWAARRPMSANTTTLMPMTSNRASGFRHDRHSASARSMPATATWLATPASDPGNSSPVTVERPDP